MEEIKEVGQDLVMTTVRLETDCSTGTGFIFSYDINGEFVPVIVTNKHVLLGGKSLTVILSYMDNGTLTHGKLVVGDISNSVIEHPEGQDLSIIPIADMWEQFSRIFGSHPLSTLISENDLPSLEEIKELKTIEDVYVIGYPNGLWDRQNNRPLVRKGITASDYKLNYDNEPKFIIDCQIYPGSSGSPVFYVSEGMRSDGRGRYTYTSPTVKLLGINHAVFIHSLKGDIIQTATINSISQIPMGLGIIIKSSELLKFKPLLENILNNIT